MSATHVDHEGTRRLITKFQPHEGKMYVQQDSHEYEKKLYDHNAKLRQLGQTGKGNVRLHLQMSEQDYVQLCQQYPLLHHGTSRQRRKLWMKIAKERPELVAIPFEKRLHAAGGIPSGR